MKKLLNNKKADVRVVSQAVGILVLIFVSILVFYNIAASIDYDTVDGNIGAAHAQPALNASNATMDQAATFYTIAPIIVIVIVAVVILRYVGMI